MCNSLLTKTGLTKILPRDVKKRIIYCGHQANGNVIIRFKTDKEGLRLAKLHYRLAANPIIKMNVKFIKIK